MGHKDYLFLKPLAFRLPMDSFRFDFRANHETPGRWQFGNIPDDVVDIQVVVDYLTKEFGYVIDLVVGHSRGSVAGMLWLCQADEAKHVRGYVNVSGRYRMQKIYGRDFVMNDENKKALASQGYFELRATIARKPFLGIVRAEDLEQFASTDVTCVWDRFPPQIDVLTLHGIKDTVVPVYDAVIYHHAFSSRSPGTAMLHLAEDADHNFSGRSEEVVNIVLEWMQKRERNEIKSGLWDLGIRGKL